MAKSRVVWLSVMSTLFFAACGDLTPEMKREKVARAPSTSSSSNDVAGVQWVTSSPAGVQFTKTEITVSQWEACKRSGRCKSNHVKDKGDSKYCNLGYGDRGNHPMNCIDWEGSKQVCEWLGGRLPKEDEWYAEASNGGDRTWPWGDSPDVSCDYAIMEGEGNDGCGKDRTWPVCSKTRGNSVSGLCDMSGNVWEWTSTKYAFGSDTRVVRGGSWYFDNPVFLRASYRFRNVPTYCFYDRGVRCVRSSH